MKVGSHKCDGYKVKEGTWNNMTDKIWQPMKMRKSK